MVTESKISLDEIRARRSKLQAEDRILAEIERGLVEVEKLWADYQSGSPQPVPLFKAPDNLAQTPVAHSRPRMTKKNMIIEALDRPRPLWQTAKDIQSYLSLITRSEVPMSSISPALTDMKLADTIVRQDMSVALALRVQDEEPDFLKENEPPEGGSETGEVPTSPIETQERKSVDG